MALVDLEAYNFAAIVENNYAAPNSDIKVENFF